MKPTERIAVLSAHMKGPKRKRRRWRWRRKNLDAVIAYQLKCWRERRDRLESERAQWQDAVARFEGRIEKICLHMGCATETGRTALWDLGLWPEVVRRNPYTCRQRRSRA